jgi:uncharacterized membrane protein
MWQLPETITVVGTHTLLDLMHQQSTAAVMQAMLDYRILRWFLVLHCAKTQALHKTLLLQKLLMMFRQYDVVVAKAQQRSPCTWAC